MCQITNRKKSELRAKHRSLQLDFDYWTKLAAQGLGLHTSQIQGLIGKDEGALSKLCATLATEVKSLDEMSAAQVLSDAGALEEMLLAAHCLWGFFREKLAQRLDAATRPFLDVADELAWGCYRPAMKAAKVKKEPPLVFLNGAWSPFMVPRGAEWNAEGVPGDLLTDGEFANVLRSLPIPIIGVPYAQVTHLPDVIFIAHETGHAVEGDFELTDLLTTSMKHNLAGSPNHEQWTAWMGECFADAWAVANVGPAYVGALQDFLAPSHAKAADNVYPPVSLRVRLARACAARMGLASEANKLHDEWKEAGLTDSTDPPDAELDKVLDALLETKIAPLGDRTVKQLGGYDPIRHAASKAAAERALTAQAIQGDDPRVLFAALRQCYEQRPATFNTPETNPARESLRERFLVKLKPTETTRATRRAAVKPASPDLHQRLKTILERKRGNQP